MSKNIILDNTIDGDCRRAITWQFDNAEKLRGTILMFRDFFTASMKNIADKVKSIVDMAKSETTDDFALSIWGKLLGFDRPTVLVNGVLVPLLSSAYRKILVAKFKLLNSNASTSSYGAFLNEVFDGAVAISQNGNMALKFEYTGTVPSEGNTEEYHLYRLFCDNPDAIFIYPAGVKDDTKGDGPIFGFDGQWTLMDNGQPAVKEGRKYSKLIVENTSVNARKCRISTTVYSINNTHPIYSVPVLALVVNGHEYHAVTWKNYYDYGSASNPKTYSVVFDGIFHGGDVNVGSTLDVYTSPSPASSSPAVLQNIQARVDGIERYESHEHDVVIPARSLFSGLNVGQRFYTQMDNIVQVGERKAVYVCSYETLSSSVIDGTETSYYQYFSYPVDRTAKEGILIQDVGIYEGDEIISWSNISRYSPFATIEPAGTGDFKVMNFDHGCFAWKRDIPLATQEQT